MKKTTCKELMGACDEVITGNTAEEMGDNSRSHTMDMVKRGDQNHQVALKQMEAMPKEAQAKWYSDFISNFDNLPDA